MQVFDRLGQRDLDRRDWQLWVLAMVMILILAGGTALLMNAFAVREGFTIAGRATLRGIFGFWLLEVLFLAYLSDRQWVIAGLRGTLAERKKRNIELRSQSNKDLLDSLFGPGQFCDRLALEVQRAMRSKLSLAGLTVGLEVALNLPDGDDPYSAFGDAVKAMMVRLRGEDSVYRIAPGVFAIILGTSSDMSRRVASRMADGLSEAMGASKRYSFDIRITSFPEHAKTGGEMESMMNVPQRG